MILSTIISYLPYALITTFTPGPNNLISFYAVSTYGWKKGAKVLAGIGSAIFLIICITAVLCHHLASNVEAALPVLKIFGSIYILWLAIHIAKDSPDNSSFDISTFKKGFILVFVNVKMLLYAITVFSGYILNSTTDVKILLLHAVILSALCISSNLTWAAAGRAFQKFLKKHYRPFNITMAVILAYCAVTLII